MKNQININRNSLHGIVGQLSVAAGRRLHEAKLKKHNSARELYLNFLKPMMEHCKETDPNQMLMGDMTADEIIAVIEDMGFWGYAHMKSGTIHCWWNNRCPRRQLIAFVCHELEHLVSRCRPKDEERRCDLTGAIAARALELLGL